MCHVAPEVEHGNRSASSGVASFDVGVLSLGNHSLLASFTSAAPGNFAPSSKTGTLTVLDVSVYALMFTVRI